MKIAARYEFNGGENIPHRYPALLDEVNAVIAAVDAPLYKTKLSKEKTMPNRLLFDPTSINKAFKTEFKQRGWSPVRVSCKYTTDTM